jgi:hypothetical protein
MKFCMNRAPLAVVVTTLAASSMSGRQYSRKKARTGFLYTSLYRAAMPNLSWCGEIWHCVPPVEECAAE